MEAQWKIRKPISPPPLPSCCLLPIRVCERASIARKCPRAYIRTTLENSWVGGDAVDRAKGRLDLHVFARVHLVDFPAELGRRLEDAQGVEHFLEPVARLPPSDIVARAVANLLRDGDARACNRLRLGLAGAARVDDGRHVAQLANVEALLNVVEARQQVLSVHDAKEGHGDLVHEPLLHVPQAKARQLKVEVEGAQEAIEIGAPRARHCLERREVLVLKLAIALALVRPLDVGRGFALQHLPVGDEVVEGGHGGFVRGEYTLTSRDGGPVSPPPLATARLNATMDLP